MVVVSRMSSVGFPVRPRRRVRNGCRSVHLGAPTNARFLRGTIVRLCPRRSFFHDHFCMNLLQLGSLNLLRPEECHEPRNSEDITTDKVRQTYVHKCLRHLSLSSPAACFAFNTSSMRRPIAARESFRMATLSSRGISSPDNLSCFCSIRQKKNRKLKSNRPIASLQDAILLLWQFHPSKD
jgi:hypothetical protein